MKLKILGSSSAGNCYVFDNGKEALVVEAGISFSEVKKAVDFDISRIVGCIISHEHGDHAKHVQKFIDARIPVYMSLGTLTKTIVSKYSKRITSKNEITIGSFQILPFNIQHDAAEPLGFIIYHPEMGTTLFATDTYYLTYTFSGLNNIIIECNYRTDILEKNVELGNISMEQQNRTLLSHMSYDTCLETLLENNLFEVNNIVLIHLSESNANAAEFQRGIQEATGKTVHIADKGVVLEFNKTPF